VTNDQPKPSFQDAVLPDITEQLEAIINEADTETRILKVVAALAEQMAAQAILMEDLAIKNHKLAARVTALEETTDRIGP